MAGGVAELRANGRDQRLALATVALVGLGVLTWMFGRPNVGLAFGWSDLVGVPVVASIEPGSIGWAAGARPGMDVTIVDGSEGVAGVDPTGRYLSLSSPGGADTIFVGPASPAQSTVLPALWAAICIGLLLWHARRRFAGEPLADTFAAPLAVAAVAPLALVALAAFGSPLTLALGSIAWPLAVWPLAETIAGRWEPEPIREAAIRLVRTAVLVAVALTPLLFVLPGPATPAVIAREALVALALLGPIALSASHRAREATSGWSEQQADSVGAVAVAGAAVVPLVVRLMSLVALDASAILFVVAAMAAAAFVVRFGVAPVVRVARTALRQRDLVGAAAEAERRRLAADLHDGPLQTLTLLAYRLDAGGDPANAALARDIVTELRAITSALRLPVVDDLGAGAALEWLTTRVERLAGTTIELVRGDTERPPIEVEHAVFRVAQEALANATWHGRPPIQVRYEADGSRASLLVTDAGGGLEDDDPLAVERGLGLFGMRERAHAIGAALDVRSSPSGTRVALVWPGAS
ncbi:MAG TPA: histidine kinase [Candidatus Limnocylindrales bacterium]|nr:histidine kinase [Candidatus Limnocylindrales bacterium]